GATKEPDMAYGGRLGYAEGGDVDRPVIVCPPKMGCFPVPRPRPTPTPQPKEYADGGSPYGPEDEIHDLNRQLEYELSTLRGIRRLRPGDNVNAAWPTISRIERAGSRLADIDTDEGNNALLGSRPLAPSMEHPEPPASPIEQGEPPPSQMPVAPRAPGMI